MSLYAPYGQHNANEGWEKCWLQKIVKGNWLRQGHGNLVGDAFYAFCVLTVSVTMRVLLIWYNKGEQNMG